MQLWELSVTQLQDGFRRRAFSPVELVHALLDRVDAVEPRIRAWQLIDAEQTLAAAADSPRYAEVFSREFTAIKGVDVAWRTGWLSDRQRIP